VGSVVWCVPAGLSANPILETAGNWFAVFAATAMAMATLFG